MTYPDCFTSAISSIVIASEAACPEPCLEVRGGSEGKQSLPGEKTLNLPTQNCCNL
jgi:hypothetical protein